MSTRIDFGPEVLTLPKKLVMLLVTTNFFDGPANALVNLVNTVGVAERGIDREFQARYPENYARYQQACRAGKLKPGGLLIVEDTDANGPRIIINLANRHRRRGRTRLPWLDAALSELRAYLLTDKSMSVALPDLSENSRGVTPEEVRMLIKRHLESLPNTIYTYLPNGIQEPDLTKLPTLKPGSTLLLEAMRHYTNQGYAVDRPALHQLTYLLQRLGGPYPKQLRFAASPKGMAAPAVDRLLDQLTGTYLSVDNVKGLRLTESALPNLAGQLAELPTSQTSLLNPLADLIRDYDSATLQLLTTVHLIRQHYTQDTFHQIVEVARGWLQRPAEGVPTWLVEEMVGRLDGVAGVLAYVDKRR